jgi:hypothetical protein
MATGTKGTASGTSIYTSTVSVTVTKTESLQNLPSPTANPQGISIITVTEIYIQTSYTTTLPGVTMT